MPVRRGESRGVAWIDDKAILKKHLIAKGFPVAHGEAVHSLRKALGLFSHLNKPVIVKPHQGSGTRHTTLHIETEAQLEKAFANAKEISPLVVIEEELTGVVYRPTVIDGVLIATIERHPPFVFGDGVHTIEELIAEINKHPKRSGPIFSQIKINAVLRSELERQGYELTSVPEKGKRVDLHPKINWSVGGHTRDVTARVHPENKKLFEDIAQMLKAPIVGIDFIIPDIARSWKEQRCGVIEANSMPFIDTHHFPFEGEVQDVAGAIWDMVFPNSKT
jgi:cyanophycin synthetase